MFSTFSYLHKSGSFNVWKYFSKVRRREEIVNAADRVASSMMNVAISTKNVVSVYSGAGPLKGVEEKGEKSF